MATPANALQAAIYTTLTGNAALTNLIGASHVYDFVPQDATPPYVVIGDDTAIDDSTKTTNGWQITVTIHCWSYQTAGRKTVKSIMSTVYDALHRQSITVSGFNLIDLQFEFEASLQDTTVEGQNDQYYHGVQRYRALIQA